MDYRERKYYLLQLPLSPYSHQYTNTVLNMLRRIPVHYRKIHLREFNIDHRCHEILISFKPEVQQKFDELKIEILRRFIVAFIEITKEN